jgi:hypothetical protein
MKAAGKPITDLAAVTKLSRPSICKVLKQAELVNTGGN